ncbi:unnamed protein product [Orchesella dallaii]|uniref:MADF domain-containing protein n=1 Tax=Orchesella dallaii TaxID=48710 RepID=A0ABP1RZN1_9HEXA
MSEENEAATSNGKESAERTENENNSWSSTDGLKPTEDQFSTVTERNAKFELIRRVGNRPLLYDSKHKHHHDRGLIRIAWRDVSKDLKLGSEQKDVAKWCQSTWKTMKDYYFKKKRDAAKKSGAGRLDGEKKGKTWEYYDSIHAILSKCAMENDATVSNFDDPPDEVQSIGESGTTLLEKDDTESANETLRTPQTPKHSSGERSRKRKRAGLDGKDATHQILQMLKDTGKDEDEAFHFGMNIAGRLRSLSPRSSRKAQMKIQALLYNIEFPPNANDSEEEMFI